MRLPSRLLRVLVILFALAAAARAEEIRVGITEYQGIESAYRKYQQLFRALEARSKSSKYGPVTFKVAIGTYGEVLDWYNKKLIDVAVLSALPMTDLLNSSLTARESVLEAYVGRIGPRPKKDSGLRCGVRADRPLNDLAPDAPTGAADFQYHTSCVVLEDNEFGVTDFDQIKELRAKSKESKRVKFLFVRPFSVSGYVLPNSFLREQGIRLSEDEYEFTYQHQDTLRRMLTPTDEERREDEGKLLVGFVIEDTHYCAPDTVRPFFHHVETELDKDTIPHEAVLVNYNLSGEKRAHYKEVMLELFNKPALPADAELDIKGREDVVAESPSGDVLAAYKQIIDVYKNSNLPRSLRGASNFDELIKSLAIYARTKGEWPRLALVLSGGGAKCAYQAGAVEAMEQRLAALQDRLRPDYEELCRGNPEFCGKKFDFDLVVGTSGGAINALFAALGATGDERTQKQLGATWRSFRQRQFFRPSLTFNLIFGLSFGLLQAIIVSVTAWAFGQYRVDWPRFGVVLLAIEAVEVGLFSYIGTLDPIVAWLVLAQVGLALLLALGVRWLQVRFERWGRTGHWWYFAGWIMVTVSALELLVALSQYVEKLTTTLTLLIIIQTLAVLAALLGAAWVKREFAPLSRRRTWVLGTLLVSGVYLALSTPALARWLGDFDRSHVLHHAWLLLMLIFLLSSPWPLIIGLFMLVGGRWRVPAVNWSTLTAAMVALLFVLGGLIFAHTLWREISPSYPTGIEEAFAEKVPGLLAVLHDGFPPPEGGTTDERLEAISRNTVAPGWRGAGGDRALLKRDLVITASKLPSESESGRGSEDCSEDEARAASQLPDDLFFYYQATGVQPPAGDKRFISFAENPGKLLDVVIGSGTIYPIFPYRVLSGLRVRGAPVCKIKIIDGGFIHNSPVQAAIDWGATHILLVEASPLQKPYNPRYFLQNASVAFKYIFAQAQRMDTVSRGSVEIFELRPTSECEKKNPGQECVDKDPEPDMDTFDFSEAILRNAFDIGLRDGGSTRPLFRRVPGPPLFREADANRRKSGDTQQVATR